MKKILVPVAVGIVGLATFAGASVEAHSPCSHGKSGCACSHGDKVEYGKRNLYMRECGIHHCWYDIRFGCPQCRAPKFGF